MKKYTLFILLLILPLATITASASDWTQFQVDVFNTGVTPDRAPISADTLDIWNRYTSSDSMTGLNTEPLVIGDLVYVVSNNDTLWALERSTGDAVWKTRTSHNFEFMLGAPAYGNGTIFVPTVDSKMFAFNATDGTQLWSVTLRTDYAQMNTPVTYEDHRIYFGGMYGSTPNKYYCFQDNGTQIWNRTSTSDGGYYRSGAVIVADNLIYGDSEAKLTSVNKYDGSTLDELDVSSTFSINANRMRSSLHYNEDTEMIYGLVEGGYCFAIGLNTDGTFNRSILHITPELDICASTPVSYNGRLYFGTGNVWNQGKLYCVDAENLSEIWSFTPADGGFQGSPVISTYYDDGDGEIYIYATANAAEGTIYCLKDMPGNTRALEQWNYTPPEPFANHILPGPVVSDGWIFFVNDEGYAFGITDGLDWNPWNDESSEGSTGITTTELQVAINCWVTSTPAPVTGAEVSTTRLQQLINDWINS